jgi:hypothetical protein
MRQQLDELDALLQRMLTLPVNQSDDAPSEPHTNGRAPAADPAPTPVLGRGPRMVLLDGSAPVPPPTTPPPAAWDPHWNINLNPQQGSSILGPRSPAAAGQRSQSETPPPVWRAETVSFPQDRSEPVPQPPLSAPAVRHEPFAPPPSERLRSEPTPAPLLPLVGINRLFDALLLCLGPPGQWFCTSAGRNLLGYAGLALLAGSVVWGAAGWFGWPR